MSAITSIIVVYLLSFLCDGTEFEASKTLATTGIDISLSIDDVAQTVEITMTAPDSSWFAVGFGGSGMNNRYAIIASGTNTVGEHILKKSDSCQCNSGVATSSLTVVSDSSDGMERTVIVTRPISTSDYTFPTAAGSLTVISAQGSGSTSVSYHGNNKQADTLTLTEVVVGPTMCCTNVAPQNKWKNTCPKKMNQNKCEALVSNNGANRCAWIDCSLVGECNWDMGTKGSQKICKKLTNQGDCDAKPFCDWTFTNAANQLDEQIFANNKSIMVENGYGHLLNNTLFIVLSVLFIFGALIYCVCRTSKQSKDVTTRKPLLNYNSV